MDANEFRSAAKQLVDYIADYLENIRDRPVLPSVQPGYIKQLIGDSAPEQGQPWSEIFNDIEKVIMPGITHWHSPHFHAYFPTANSYPSICADMLSSALAVIGFTWISSPACTELEMQMMDWLAKMLDLPQHFMFSSGGKGGGVIQGTASEATYVTLLAARNKLLAQHNNNKDILNKLVAYASSQSHSSVERAGLLGAIQIKQLPTDDKLSLRGDTLSNQIQKDRADGLIPFYVVATLGTTNTCAFDNLLEIGKVCEEEELWLHIDAAFAGSAFICPEFRHHLNGVEYASSFNLNPHKWMLINFDCSTLWIKNADYIVNAFNVNPVYLRHDKQGQIPDYRHWQIPLGRRFRSLKMWFVFRSFGVQGLQNHIRKQVELAKLFEELVASDDRFEIITKRELSLVCFRLKGSNEINEKLVKLINDNKNIHVTPTRVAGQFIIRFAVCARTTEAIDIDFAWREICRLISQTIAQ
ncbi:aromatic-L-amino-acid decarboxylase-like [Oppia nitens]|uniref:aromatic-L-amino-acid decarboxylase-like n=1 Tax=Oppia nitens TaxID=1686743 RepID=UPI0023DCB809|nr:aromatic-L-amino-acid decarboxylase-like [Oppia nitens]